MARLLQRFPKENPDACEAEMEAFLDELPDSLLFCVLKFDVTIRRFAVLIIVKRVEWYALRKLLMRRSVMNRSKRWLKMSAFARVIANREEIRWMYEQTKNRAIPLFVLSSLMAVNGLFASTVRVALDPCEGCRQIGATVTLEEYVCGYQVVSCSNLQCGTDLCMQSITVPKTENIYNVLGDPECQCRAIDRLTTLPCGFHVVGNQQIDVFAFVPPCTQLYAIIQLYGSRSVLQYTLLCETEPNIRHVQDIVETCPESDRILIRTQSEEGCYLFPIDIFPVFPR